MQKQNIYWPSVLTFSLLGFASLIFLGAAVVVSVSAFSLLFSQDSSSVVTSSMGLGFVFEALIVGVAAIFSLRRLMEIENLEKLTYLVQARWHISVALTIACTFVGIGALIVTSRWLNFLLIPVLTLGVVALPIWAFMSVGIFDLEIGSRWRAWAIFGMGMTLGPIIMMVLEIITAVLLVVVWALVIVAKPELMTGLQSLVEQAQHINDPEVMVNLVSPYLMNPAVLGTVYLYIALLVPMVEEIFKPIGVWLFARRINSPAQGFAMGLLSGAAYALVESIGVVDQGGANWAVVVSTRAGTSLLHITTTGLMGWAIASVWLERRYLRLLLTYLLAITLHGLWNAAAVTISVFSVSMVPDPKDWHAIVVWGAAGVLLFLIMALLGILFVANKRARDSAALRDSPVEPMA